MLRGAVTEFLRNEKTLDNYLGFLGTYKKVGVPTGNLESLSKTIIRPSKIKQLDCFSSGLLHMALNQYSVNWSDKEWTGLRNFYGMAPCRSDFFYSNLSATKSNSKETFQTSQNSLRGGRLGGKPNEVLIENAPSGLSGPRNSFHLGWEGSSESRKRSLLVDKSPNRLCTVPHDQRNVSARRVGPYGPGVTGLSL